MKDSDQEAQDYHMFESGATAFRDMSDYMTASQRRRFSRPSIYLHQHPTQEQEQRSGVLRALFAPRPSEILDLAQPHTPLYLMLHPNSQTRESHAYQKCITVLIGLDVVLFAISTDENIYDHYTIWFRVLEGIISSIFLCEYIARAYVCIENTRYGSHGPIGGRLRYLTSYLALIDFLATSPFFLQLATGWLLDELSYLRILRVLRIVRTDHFARTYSACYRVIYFNREILSVAFLICTMLIVSCSLLLYYMRPRNGANDVEFDSIPSALYLSVLILTGQDTFIQSSADMPWYTKIVICITGALSVGMYAIPVSLLTWGFEAEAERCAKKTRKMVQSTKIPTMVATSPNSSTSDDEYLKIIANGSSGSSDDTQRMERLHSMMEVYMKNDDSGRRYYALADFLVNSGKPSVQIDPFQAMEAESLGSDVGELQSQVRQLQTQIASFDSKLEFVCKMLTKQNDTGGETASHTDCNVQPPHLAGDEH
eukprot:Nitzschia sp. Nitz4//scaffold35_size145790//121931//123460//NITZ4_003054-RA/size145790-exonerate_est2genome-gene-0.119-mRNA-1//1//CDS//3329549196//5962//frame0